MTRNIIFFGLALFLISCSGGSPVDTKIDGSDVSLSSASAQSAEGPHRLWGQYLLYFDRDHTTVEVAPIRQAGLHLNALKFLESYCTDCLEITKFVNNGDGTYDLTLSITHPFPDNPEYTGFDVKGIIMFNGSHELSFWSMSGIYPDVNKDGTGKFHVSWRELGDPEVLNPDGYSVLWSPWWISGSTMPIFNYWKGKYSFGTPSANINAFINFYTDEERHMFRVDGTVERTYKLFLPPGPLVAGYAVDACWEPPTVTPVTDPLNDFPISANQPEPYFYRYVLNNDEPITFEPCCGAPDDCSDLRHEYSKWYGDVNNAATISFSDYPGWNIKSDNGMNPCDQIPPNSIVWLHPTLRFVTNYYPQDGNYRGVAVSFWKPSPSSKAFDLAYTVFDFTIDLE